MELFVIAVVALVGGILLVNYIVNDAKKHHKPGAH
jgi:hypothetical protein